MSKPIRRFLSFLLVLQLVIPYSTFAAAVGEFTWVIGNVKQTRAKEVIRPVVKSPVELKDLIVTERASLATMVFSDDSKITLSENTKLEIKEFLFKDKSRRGVFSLPFGKLTADVRKYIGGANVFEVHSPTVAVGVRGTGFEFVEAMKEGNVDANIASQGMATVTCTEGSLNLSAYSPKGEIISTAVLEAGQVAVIIGGIITISKIGAAVAAALAARTTETGAAGAAGGTGAGGTAAGGASGGAATAATAGTAVAATGLSTAAITGMAIGGAAVVGVAAAAAGGSGGGGSSSAPCSDKDGYWSGSFSGIACGVSDGGTWVANCSKCSCTVTRYHNNGQILTGIGTISGNSFSATRATIGCNGVSCTLNYTGTFSGSTLNGTVSGCTGISQTWTGSRQ
jgi:hypothetical protein